MKNPHCYVQTFETFVVYLEGVREPRVVTILSQVLCVCVSCKTYHVVFVFNRLCLFPFRQMTADKI
jgi:hypothetical protein